jgi:hypothetical protein
MRAAVVAHLIQSMMDGPKFEGLNPATAGTR